MSRIDRTATGDRTPADSSSGGFGYDLPDDLWLQRVHEALDGSLAPSGVLHDCRVGGRIGPYTLIGEIGRGGMGTVWRARRADGAFDRDVAIKLIRRGLDSEQILRRFELERQVLARLEHPGIARLYDGGTTADGQPYLVLELVDGTPIDAFCRAVDGDIDAALALFERVCRTVHFAHTNLVLHRDLKPGNVLVSPTGEVKLLDFGIAKLLDDHADALTRTRDDPILTPRYASPEQIRGERLATTSDVYSLGVMLYELVSGESPYEPHTSSRAAIEAAALQQDPRPASEAVERSGLPPAIRRTRARQLRGDLDAVLAKALEKRPADRYASAEQFGEDLRRLREGLPLLARGPGPLARVARAWRRNQRAVLAAGTVISILLMVGSWMLSYSLLAPRWAQQRLRDAHLAFLTPDLANDIWVLSFNNADELFNRHKPPACRLELAERALEEYEAALRLDPDQPDLQIERDAVWLAAHITAESGREPAIPSALRNAAPLASDYARRWTLEAVIPELDDAALVAAPREDLRALGLVAMLCGDARTCLRAWQRLGVYRADPLVEALLGILHLTRDAPDRAYPRLLSAYRAYPELGFLATYLADAALGCGDLEFARELLDRAEGLPHQDPQGARDRVRLKHFALSGRTEDADRLFFEQGVGANFVARIQYARDLFDAGRERTALRVLVHGCGLGVISRQVPAPMMRALFELTQAWWTRQSALERRATIAEAIGDSCDDPGSLFRILRAYALSVDRTERFHREQALAGGAGALATHPLLTTETHAELLALHERLDIDNAYRWGLFDEYPPELRAQQVRAWLDAPDPVAATRRVDEAFAAWRPDHHGPGNAVVKLLPGDADGDAFGRFVSIDGDVAVVTTASQAIAYRHDAGAWLREEIMTPDGWAVIEAVVQDQRILLLTGAAPGGQQSTRLSLARHSDAAGAWVIDTDLPLPEDCPAKARVRLAGNTAAVAPVFGPVFLFGRDDASAGWRLEHVLDRDDPVQWRSPYLTQGTLVLVEEEPRSTLWILDRSAEGRWSVEAQLSPPEGTSWRSAACFGSEVLASAAEGSNEPRRLLRWACDAAGTWQQVEDLLPILPDAPWHTGQRLAADGSRIAVTSGDRSRHSRSVAVLEWSGQAWIQLADLDPGDLGFGDRAGTPALSGDWLILGAPDHDAAGRDRGAAYLFYLGSPAAAAHPAPVESTGGPDPAEP